MATSAGSPFSDTREPAIVNPPTAPRRPPSPGPPPGERSQQAFDRGTGHGLLRLGAAEVGQVLPPVFAYWRELGSRFVTALCTRPDTDEYRADFPPPPDDLEVLAAAAPVMPGAEYLTADVLRSLW